MSVELRPEADARLPGQLGDICWTTVRQNMERPAERVGSNASATFRPLRGRRHHQFGAQARFPHPPQKKSSVACAVAPPPMTRAPPVWSAESRAAGGAPAGCEGSASIVRWKSCFSKPKFHPWHRARWLCLAATLGRKGAAFCRPRVWGSPPGLQTQPPRHCLD